MYLSEKYFEMNKKQCKEGLDIYKKFLVRMERVSEMLKVAEVSSEQLKEIKCHLLWSILWIWSMWYLYKSDNLMLQVVCTKFSLWHFGWWILLSCSSQAKLVSSLFWFCSDNTALLTNTYFLFPHFFSVRVHSTNNFSQLTTEFQKNIRLCFVAMTLLQILAHGTTA